MPHVDASCMLADGWRMLQCIFYMLDHDRVCFPASFPASVPASFPASFVTLVHGCMLATSRTTVAFATISPGNSFIRVASHRIASHRIASHRVASRRVASDLKQKICGNEVATATICARSVCSACGMRMQMQMQMHMPTCTCPHAHMHMPTFTCPHAHMHMRMHMPT